MSKIPKYANEQEEAEFWAAHDSTEFLNDTEAVDVTFVDSRPPKKQIALRLDGATIDALKAVASRKGIGYQTLIRLWVNERLEQGQIGALRSWPETGYLSGNQTNNNTTASSAMPAPNKNGADGPKPAQQPTPCHNTPATRLAGKAARPMAAL